MIDPYFKLFMSISSEEHWDDSRTWGEEYEHFTNGRNRIVPYIFVLTFKL